MEWARILAYTAGTVDQELRLRNEYLAAENRILRAQLNGCLRLSDAERATLGEIGFRLGRKALSEVATVAQPDTILAWHRRLFARKFEGSRARRVRGRPRIDREVEGLIIRMAEENRSWGYDRIAGALANLGHEVSDQTVGNVLRRHGIPPAPELKRRTTWAEFIRIHLALLAGTYPLAVGGVGGEDGRRHDRGKDSKSASKKRSTLTNSSSGRRRTDHAAGSWITTKHMRFPKFPCHEKNQIDQANSKAPGTWVLNYGLLTEGHRS
jgi:Homeodomain-like domain